MLSINRHCSMPKTDFGFFFFLLMWIRNSHVPIQEAIACTGLKQGPNNQIDYLIVYADFRKIVRLNFVIGNSNLVGLLIVKTNRETVEAMLITDNSK